MISKHLLMVRTATLLYRAVVVIWLGCLWSTTASAASGEPTVKDLTPRFGPHTAELGRVARVRVPAGYLFLDAEDTRTLMRQMGNTSSGKELGTIAKKDDNWFIVFEFDPVGYVNDTDMHNLNADAILRTIKANNERANQYRRERGMRTMQIIGWQKPPTYNPLSNNLEWSVRATSEGLAVVNHNTRVLGRSGVMQVVLVVDPDRLASVSHQAALVMAGFSYVPGERYGQWRSGDRIADYGLTALVVGGSASMAMKSGLLKKLAKPFLVGLTLIGGVSGRFFRFSRRQLR